MITTIWVYFIFLVIGISFNLAGVLSIDISRKFHVDTAVVGYIFSLFTLGYSLAILVNGRFLDRINMKVLMFGAVGLTCIGIAAATMTDVMLLFGAAILVAGVGMGVLSSSGNYFIVCSYKGRERTAKLNILNFFFSFGAIISPFAAGRLLAAQFSWEQVYLLSLAPLAVLGIALIVVRFSFGRRQQEGGKLRQDAWHAGIYFIAAALFSYVVSEMILTYWIVIYLVEQLHLTLAPASLALSLFWISMAIGRLLTGIAANKIPVVNFLLCCSFFSFLMFGWMLYNDDPIRVIALIAALGLGYSGLYASILAYGTMQLNYASSKLMTLFVSVGSVGGICSFLLSSYLKQQFSVAGSLLLSGIAMGLVFSFIGAASLFNRRRRRMGDKGADGR
jgi:TsgA-like MFS transporter